MDVIICETLVESGPNDIRSALKERGWTFVRGANSVGMSVRQFSALINLKRFPDLTIEQYVKLVELTGKTLEEMFPQQVHSKEFLHDQRGKVAVSQSRPSELICSGIVCAPVPLDPPSFDLLAILEELLKVLTEREREVIVARYIEGLKFREIGDMLSISKQRAQQIESSARKKLHSLAIQARPDLFD